MIYINPHYQKLQSSYLFSQIAKIMQEEQEKNPDLTIIKLGIGDVTKALLPSIISAFHKGVDEMAKDSTFRGYGPEQGYEFLRTKIANHDFKEKGIAISAEEIIISDGSKCDVGNFQEIFSTDIKVAVPDPVYPVYIDTNVMAGRSNTYKNNRYEGLTYLVGTKENDFIPPPPTEKTDLLYLCFPNNPTGVVATHKQLKAYVDYALENDALLLFDAAYCEYITEKSLPQSIFEIQGAKKCAVEFRSFSKTAGFTGVRCAYTIIPNECRAFNAKNEPIPLRDLWLRRHTTKSNGVSYPVQKAATAVYSPEGKLQIQERITYYMENAQMIRNAMLKKNIKVYGGINAPFIWIDAKENSWELFRKILTKTGVVTTPGSGFGKCGEKFIRISAFNHRENVEEALKRLEAYF